MGKGISNEDYKNSNLTITESKITTDLALEEVMMDWEDPLMQEHANIVCHNQGDILEFGFGMGISANYIQALNPSSHTIIEIHPQIWNNLETWAEGKSNVNIINADWIDVVETLGQFDGIFFDTYGDVNWEKWFYEYWDSRMKPGGKMTYFNQHDENDFYNIGATFHSVSITPDPNEYFNRNTYYVPTVNY